MEVVNVIGPPPESFNKRRRISDLVRMQVEHFKHIAYTLGPAAHATIPHRQIVTEHDAAEFIAAMTRILKKQKDAVTPARRKTKEITLALAAAADTLTARAPGKRGAKKKSVPRKKSANKKKAATVAKKSAPAAKKAAPAKKASAAGRKNTAVKKKAAATRSVNKRRKR